jgi:serine/threonine protein kinase
MLELVDAVDYIHSKGIYHRDIKPENIFLTQDGSMKLGDFGLATTEKWTNETTVGSDRYMSPEQYDSAGAGYSPSQADIWAIGICLLNILFSRNPFTTPTEADPLFLDFSRDKQSLFDVFPSMSQDTYEVIVQCMNLDPSKRSLVGARNALRRVVSFTTLDEVLDDFCSAERHTIASSNREPLRTPSIQSPQVDAGAFPWAKALQASPQKPARRLSVIRDNESYTEDLFSKSDETTNDWCSGTAQTPSISSFLDSSLGASMKSLGISNTKVSPMAGSLPITMSKPGGQSALAFAFGRKDAVSKSWSDMWDEDVEEEAERDRQLQALKEMNSRTWSHESKVGNDETPRQGLSPATTSVTVNGETDVPSIESTILNDVDDDLAADGLFFYEPPPPKQVVQSPPRYSPPPKRTTLDKWAALGERRRAFTGNSTPTKSPEVPSKPWRQVGNGSGFGSHRHGVLDFPGNTYHNSSSFFTINSSSSNYHQNNHHMNGKWNYSNKDRAKDCPWNKGRDRDWNFNWRKEKRIGSGDVEWVGGWQESHS